MKEADLRQHINELSKGIEATWNSAYKRMLEMQAQIDHIKLEVVALKKILSEKDPGFGERYQQILEETLQEAPPE